jgi:hypothetical protein
LVVHLNRPAGRTDEAAILRESIHEYFGQRVVASRRKLRALFRRGRISLVIAVAFLTACIAVGDALAGYLGESRLSDVIREGFLIGGWVAMWRPLEVFLYDWWPIRAEARLLQRLSTIPVRIEYREDARGDAWRSDWPEVSTAERPRGNAGAASRQGDDERGANDGIRRHRASSHAGGGTQDPGSGARQDNR